MIFLSHQRAFMFTIIKDSACHLVLFKDRTPEEKQYPIFVALERGLNVSRIANIHPTAIESQI